MFASSARLSSLHGLLSNLGLLKSAQLLSSEELPSICCSEGPWRLGFLSMSLVLSRVDPAKNAGRSHWEAEEIFPSSESGDTFSVPARVPSSTCFL